MTTPPPVGLLFVHGISNGRSAREGMRDRFKLCLKEFNVPFTDQYVDAAIWRSSGRFDYDLDILYRVDGLREDAIDDVATAVMRLHDKLPPNGRLLVVGHSMGQVLGYCALDMLKDTGKLVKPFSYLSLGGPLGNTNPIYKSYLAFARRRGPLRGLEWVDVWNPDDPICANIVSPERLIDLLPLPKSIVSNVFHQMTHAIASLDPKHGNMYQPYENMRYMSIEYPGDFQPTDPMREHSSYFKSKECFDTLKKMLTNLEKL